MLILTSQMHSVWPVLEAAMVMPLKIHECKENKIHESKRNIMNLRLSFMNLRENGLKINEMNPRLRFTKLLLDSWI